MYGKKAGNPPVKGETINKKTELISACRHGNKPKTTNRPVKKKS